jgi:hypothetical protein
MAATGKCGTFVWGARRLISAPAASAERVGATQVPAKGGSEDGGVVGEGAAEAAGGA